MHGTQIWQRRSNATNERSVAAMAQAAVDVAIEEDTIDMMDEDSDEDRDEAGAVVDYRRPISELRGKALEWSTCRILNGAKGEQRRKAGAKVRKHRRNECVA